MKESTTESIEDYPKLKDGHIDFMTMVEQMFPGQLEVISYVKGLTSNCTQLDEKT